MTSSQHPCGFHRVLRHHQTVPLLCSHERGSRWLCSFLNDQSRSPVLVESLKLLAHAFNWSISRDVGPSCEQSGGLHLGRAAARAGGAGGWAQDKAASLYPLPANASENSSFEDPACLVTTHNRMLCTYRYGSYITDLYVINRCVF